jgi:hypothetical protein
MLRKRLVGVRLFKLQSPNCEGGTELLVEIKILGGGVCRVSNIMGTHPNRPQLVASRIKVIEERFGTPRTGDRGPGHNLGGRTVVAPTPTDATTNISDVAPTPTSTPNHLRDPTHWPGKLKLDWMVQAHRLKCSRALGEVEVPHPPRPAPAAAVAGDRPHQRPQLSAV